MYEYSFLHQHEVGDKAFYIGFRYALSINKNSNTHLKDLNIEANLQLDHRISALRKLWFSSHTPLLPTKATTFPASTCSEKP